MYGWRPTVVSGSGPCEGKGRGGKEKKRRPLPHVAPARQGRALPLKRPLTGHRQCGGEKLDWKVRKDAKSVGELPLHPEKQRSQSHDMPRRILFRPRDRSLNRMEKSMPSKSFTSTSIPSFAGRPGGSESRFIPAAANDDDPDPTPPSPAAAARPASVANEIPPLPIAV